MFLSSFDKTNSNGSIKPSSNKKLHLDRLRNDKIFHCPTNDCVKTFLNSKSLEEHISMGKHVYNIKGIDQVKQMYIHHITNSDFNKFNNNDSVTSNI